MKPEVISHAPEASDEHASVDDASATITKSDSRWDRVLTILYVLAATLMA